MSKAKQKGSSGVSIAICVIVLLAFVVGACYWFPPKAKINQKWIAFYSLELDPKMDMIGAYMLQKHCGCIVAEYHKDNPPDLNKWGQNIIMVGGAPLMQEFPWLQRLAIVEPNIKPNVLWSYTEDKWHIYTEDQVYTPNNEDQDLGTITVAYDRSLHRYVVVIIGYSATSTITGCALVSVMGIPKAGGYIVYLRTGDLYTHETAPEEVDGYNWRMISQP